MVSNRSKIAGAMIAMMSSVLLGIAVVSASPLQAQTVPTLTVDAASNQHAIDPNIYGISSYGLDPTFAQEIQVPNVRWGGDGSSRYNWQIDSSNPGFDWWFTGGNGEANPVPGAQVDAMINKFKPANAAGLVTIPIIPYVNKSSEYNCSFPVSVYGTQKTVNPEVTNCGNSIATSGTQLTDTNIALNNIPNTPALQQAWVEHLVATFGSAAKGGVPYYQLDNEPFGWGNTHRDIEPGGPTYATIVSQGELYAAAVKAGDPTAKVLGPSDFPLGGWLGVPSAQNNLFAGQYYLQQMAAYDASHKQRILDYFDEHYYPSFSGATAQLTSTRALWDTTYNSGSWIEKYYFYGPMELIPRFQSWIGTYYPGTKLAVSEYSFSSGQKVISDAIAEADVLGIFGRQQVDLASLWGAPKPTEPTAYAFRLYRNYDGQGGQFGSTSVESASTDQTQLAVYGAKRNSDGSLTLIVLNKTAAAIQTTLSIANFPSAGSAALYSYSGANLSAITSLGNVSLAANGLSYDYPAYSATVIVVAAATQQPIANGTYTITNLASKLVLDDPGHSQKAGTQIIEYASDAGPNQHWTFTFQNGYYKVSNGSSGMYLTDADTTGETTGPLLQEALVTADAQLWSITGSAGKWVMRNKASGLVVADPGSSTKWGTKIVVEQQAGGTNESWGIQ